MKKVIRLTESELVQLVKRVIKEQGPWAPGMEPKGEKSSGVSPNVKPQPLKPTLKKTDKMWMDMRSLLTSNGFKTSQEYKGDSINGEYFGEDLYNPRIKMRVNWYNNVGGGHVNTGKGLQGPNHAVIEFEDEMADKIFNIYDGKLPMNLKKQIDPSCLWIGKAGLIGSPTFGVYVWCKSSMKKIIDYANNLK